MKKTIEVEITKKDLATLEEIRTCEASQQKKD